MRNLQQNNFISIIKNQKLITLLLSMIIFVIFILIYLFDNYKHYENSVEIDDVSGIEFKKIDIRSIYKLPNKDFRNYIILDIYFNKTADVGSFQIRTLTSYEDFYGNHGAYSKRIRRSNHANTNMMDRKRYLIVSKKNSNDDFKVIEDKYYKGFYTVKIDSNLSKISLRLDGDVFGGDSFNKDFSLFFSIASKDNSLIKIRPTIEGVSSCKNFEGIYATNDSGSFKPYKKNDYIQYGEFGRFDYSCVDIAEKKIREYINTILAVLLGIIISLIIQILYSEFSKNESNHESKDNLKDT